jgi:uncharacterized protein YgiM (DUF1202 family)
MQHTPFYGTILIVVVAALSLIAGLAVVIATSPESIRLANLQQATAQPATATQFATQTSTASAVTATSVPTATAEVTKTSTPEALVSETPTETPTEPVITGTPFPTLAPDAIALGQIVTVNNSTARLRSAPGLDGKVISAVLAGEYVQVLGGLTTVDEIDWLPVRINSGINGWISADLVETITTATPL